MYAVKEDVGIERYDDSTAGRVSYQLVFSCTALKPKGRIWFWSWVFGLGPLSFEL